MHKYQKKKKASVVKSVEVSSEYAGPDSFTL